LLSHQPARLQVQPHLHTCHSGVRMCRHATGSG
jgi:hypothetical protein